jgi:hypothetical protein
LNIADVYRKCSLPLKSFLNFVFKFRTSPIERCWCPSNVSGRSTIGKNLPIDVPKDLSIIKQVDGLSSPTASNLVELAMIQSINASKWMLVF